MGKGSKGVGWQDLSGGTLNIGEQKCSQVGAVFGRLQSWRVKIPCGCWGLSYLLSGRVQASAFSSWISGVPWEGAEQRQVIQLEKPEAKTGAKALVRSVHHQSPTMGHLLKHWDTLIGFSVLGQITLQIVHIYLFARHWTQHMHYFILILVVIPWGSHIIFLFI